MGVPDIPPKNWRKKNKPPCFGATNKVPIGKRADEGRNRCLTNQQFDVTSARKNRRSLPYTPPKPGMSKRDKPQQRYHKLDPAELLECHQAYQTWTKGGKIKADSPIPGLKKKYPA